MSPLPRPKGQGREQLLEFLRASVATVAVEAVAPQRLTFLVEEEIFAQKGADFLFPPEHVLTGQT
jgi:hypothetical protein